MNDLAIYPNLNGKLVLITGASAGIGKATAYHFAACGSNLILLARRYERLVSIRDELTSRYGVKVYIYKVDLSNQESIMGFWDGLEGDLRLVDILVNNAGLALGLENTWNNNMENVNVVIDTNIKSIIMMVKLFVPLMIERSSGHIINVGSITGKETYAGGSIYSGTKHFVLALTESLRLELMSTPIRVSLISPGLVHTEFSMVRYSGDGTLAIKPYTGLVPLYGEDIADNIVYIASRPKHVQVADIVTFCTNQAACRAVHRE